MKKEEQRDTQIPVCELVEKNSICPAAHKAIPSSSSCLQLKICWCWQNPRTTFTQNSLKYASDLLEPVTQHMISLGLYDDSLSWISFTHNNTVAMKNMCTVSTSNFKANIFCIILLYFLTVEHLQHWNTWPILNSSDSGILQLVLLGFCTLSINRTQHFGNWSVSILRWKGAAYLLRWVCLIKLIVQLLRLVLSEGPNWEVLPSFSTEDRNTSRFQNIAFFSEY
jgi:hypothetical protein